MYGDGISLEGDIVDLGVKYELLDKSGAWYAYKGERIGQGRDQAVRFLKENEKMTQDLRTQILNATIHKNKAQANAPAGSEKATTEKTVEKAVKKH